MRLSLLLAVAALGLPAAAQAKAPPGVWQNPKGTVRVQFRDCGPAICGRIIWASPPWISASFLADAPPVAASNLWSSEPDGTLHHWSKKEFRKIEMLKLDRPLAAMADRFQITCRCASRLVVITKRRRPLRCSAAIRSRKSLVV